ncbi:endo-type membrane-bound lytic murein transglycosylase A [Salmonella enterica subsp. enterica serovar Choleraesuis]|nr:endo-type membrane-bound lytic murein transglycosylase A [Salmonella enterica subsp. enterica serovar Choleraesuis]
MLRWFMVLMLLIAGCSSNTSHRQTAWNPSTPTERALMWMPISEATGEEWGVSPRLITAIIAVESGGNPTLVSKSNAVGLMQIKASTAGREVYRHQGISGQPSNSELKDPARNITIGTAYLSILEHGILRGIEDPQTMQYALVVSYANGAGALLRMFSSSRPKAIAKINSMSPDEFYQYITENHPASQAQRYIWKINQVMSVL